MIIKLFGGYLKYKFLALRQGIKNGETKHKLTELWIFYHKKERSKNNKFIIKLRKVGLLNMVGHIICLKRHTNI